MSDFVFQPYDSGFAANPYPTYARLRDRHPFYLSEELGLTLVSRYRDITRLLADKRLGRTTDHLLPPEALEQKRSSDEWRRLPNYSRYVRVNLLETEGADHARLRQVVSGALNPRRIRKLRDRIRSVVERLLDELTPTGGMDFIEDFAVPLPVYMISELLGWPAGERHRLRPWSADIVRLYEKDATPADEERAETASREFALMLNEIAEQRLEDPMDDFISALVYMEHDPDTPLTRDEVIATCMLLLNAGHEATVNAAGNGMLALFRHPAEFDRLKENPGVVKTAVEEMLRFESPLHLFHRHVLEDIDFDGTRLREGDTLGLLYGSANRDPAAFDDPDRFDISRQPNRHLAFGAGTHFCLGAPLARLELELLFTTLLERLPGITLDEPAPEFRTGLVFRGLKQLRVRWA